MDSVLYPILIILSVVLGFIIGRWRDIAEYLCWWW